MANEKRTELGARFQFPENVEFSMDGFVSKITEKMVCEMAEKYDDFVVESIAEVARKAGVSDCTVLNKKAILKAIEKQIPKKPVEIAKSELYGRCAICGNTVHVGNRYCDQCGQSLEWED